VLFLGVLLSNLFTSDGYRERRAHRKLFHHLKHARRAFVDLLNTP